MMEWIISLSAPQKQGEPEAPNGIDSENRYYVGPKTWHDNDGVRGSFRVTDPGVLHDIDPDVEIIVVVVLPISYQNR